MEVLTTSPSPTIPDAVVQEVAAPVTPGTEAPKPEVKEEPLSGRFAALARKQKALELERQKVKQERSSNDAERVEYMKWKEDQGKPKPKLSPLEALQAAGYSYEDASNFVMNDNRPTPELKIKEFESKLEKMERESIDKEESRRSSEKASQEQAQAQAIEEFKSSIEDYVTKNPDAYELTALHEAQGLIYDTISAHYEQTMAEGKPVILSTKEAADMVEAYLEEQVERSIATKKLKAKHKPSDEVATEPEEDTSARTLTNSSSLAPVAKGKSLTDDERKKRALALMG